MEDIFPYFSLCLTQISPSETSDNYIMPVLSLDISKRNESPSSSWSWSQLEYPLSLLRWNTRSSHSCSWYVTCFDPTPWVVLNSAPYSHSVYGYSASGAQSRKILLSTCCLHSCSHSPAYSLLLWLKALAAEFYSTYSPLWSPDLLCKAVFCLSIC